MIMPETDEQEAGCALKRIPGRLDSRRLGSDAPFKPDLRIANWNRRKVL